MQEARSPAPAPVVVGFDGSPDARRAAVWAAALARARGGRALHLVSTRSPSPPSLTTATTT